MGTEGCCSRDQALWSPWRAFSGTVGLGPGVALKETRPRVCLVHSVALGEGLTEDCTSKAQTDMESTEPVLCWRASD